MRLHPMRFPPEFRLWIGICAMVKPRMADIISGSRLWCFCGVCSCTMKNIYDTDGHEHRTLLGGATSSPPSKRNRHSPLVPLMQTTRPLVR